MKPLTKGTQRHNIFSSKNVVWDEEKNALLKQTRGVCFDDAKAQLAEDRILDIIIHPDQWKYPGQQIAVIEVNGYAYFVPFVESSGEIVLKTIFPNRTATKKYLRR